MLPKKLPAKQVNKNVGEYSLQKDFLGYNARVDPTTLTPNNMISPSQNVLIGTSGRIAQVKGYVLDGQASTVIDSGILSFYDFDNFKGDRRNMRAGFLTTAGNDGKLQFRYQVGTTVTWVNLLTGLTTVKLSFCDYWDLVPSIKYVLWVDGSANVFKWNGAVTTFASATAATLTKQGTNTFAQEGFTATGSITINGITATYTGGSTTTTLTGVSVDLSAQVAATELHQTPVTTTLASMTAPPDFPGFTSIFFPTVIGCGRKNQVYLGSSTSNNLCISKANDFTSYTFTVPGRLPSEGARITLDAPPRAFVPQEVTAIEGGPNAYDMWVSEGFNTWSAIRMTLSSDLLTETIQHIRLKVAGYQAAQSSKLVGKMKNHIMYVDNNNIANFIGYISYEFIPTIVDFSFPIVNDMFSYDFTDASIFYHENFVYLAIPKQGLVRAYNMTDQTKDSFSQYKAIEDVTQMPWFWESPIGYPISGFYVVDGDIYGHNYTTSESYKLFTGGSFNGNNIVANATFAFDDKGDRTQSKASDEIWVEGYIKQNTNLSVKVVGDLDACQTSQTTIINGSDSRIVCFGGGGSDNIGRGHSLGQVSLGSQPLGGSITKPPDKQFLTVLPAWFHVAKTYPQVPCYLEQITFTSNGVDLQWEIITFGTNSRFTPEGNSDITE